MNLCILIPLLVGLISAFLGYLLGKQGRDNGTNEVDGDLKVRISDLEKELETCKSNNKSLQVSLEATGKGANLESNLRKVGAIDDSREYKLRLKVAELGEELTSYKKSAETLEEDLKECTKACKNLEEKLKQSTENTGTNKELELKVTNLEADLEKCNKNNESLQANLDIARNVSFLASKGVATEEIAFDASAAKAVYGKKIKQDDLTLIEGIGPKIQELFHNHGVKTWKELSECSVEKCQEVLNTGGDRYRIHSPNTWPKQARLAYEGLWQKLSDWQDELDGGRES